MREFLLAAVHYCWPCSQGRCEQVTRKDNACHCCRANHRP